MRGWYTPSLQGFVAKVVDMFDEHVLLKTVVDFGFNIGDINAFAAATRVGSAQICTAKVVCHQCKKIGNPRHELGAGRAGSMMLLPDPMLSDLKTVRQEIGWEDDKCRSKN